MIRVFVSGASGNVGKTIVRTIQTAEGFELVGGWCLEDGRDLGVLAGIGEIGVLASNDMEKALIGAKPDVVIDFTATPVVEGNLKLYLKHGLNVVVGTTGLTEEQIAPYKNEVAAKGLRWSVIPNYGLGISLVSEFIKKVREYYPFVSIIDQHTNEMANAPSGTAAALAQAAAGDVTGEVKSKETYPGVLGADIAGTQVISQRLPWPGPYSAHIATLARKDELIKITVEDHTSDIYMDGVFLTAQKLGKAPAGTFYRSLAEVMAQ